MGLLIEDNSSKIKRFATESQMLAIYNDIRRLLNVEDIKK